MSPTSRMAGASCRPKRIICARFANSQVGHGETLIRPKASETYDYEGEPAVIIGQLLPARAENARKK